MAIVVRLGPLPLGGRRAARAAELERILGTDIELIEVFSVAELAAAARPDVIAVAWMRPHQASSPRPSPPRVRARSYDHSGGATQ